MDLYKNLWTNLLVIMAGNMASDVARKVIDAAFKLPSVMAQMELLAKQMGGAPPGIGAGAGTSPVEGEPAQEAVETTQEGADWVQSILEGLFRNGGGPRQQPSRKKYSIAP